MVLDQVGIALGPLLASAGVVGLAIGFGAQSLVADYLSGLLIMIEDQYGVGDSVDLGEAIGEVEHIGLRLTHVRDLNGGPLAHPQRRDPARPERQPGLGTCRAGRPRGLRSQS
ncbi:mechanosensitive ion channel family protein [Streptomyces sp. CA-132043]|uniref:mechanosensitive ion channel family protein n=1 Tax=Streptomyces sp. CA-132043 TaxID=3240048 RepID=UPI003D8EEFD5